MPSAMLELRLGAILGCGVRYDGGRGIEEWVLKKNVKRLEDAGG